MALEHKSCQSCQKEFKPRDRRQLCCSPVCSKSYKTKNFPSTYTSKERDKYLQKKYGISLEEYELILSNQGGLCKICGTKPTTKSLHVDHDHQTGLIRGLLCYPCNDGLGNFKDNPALLDFAKAYLVPCLYIRENIDPSEYPNILPIFKRVIKEAAASLPR